MSINIVDKKCSSKVKNEVLPQVFGRKKDLRAEAQRPCFPPNTSGDTLDGLKLTPERGDGARYRSSVKHRSRNW